MRVRSFVVPTLTAIAIAGAALISTLPNLYAETPQPVDTTGLKPLGKTWLKKNPYQGNPKAIEIGKNAYNENCARCHGLEAISGGIAPDLRKLPLGEEGDQIFEYRVRHGYIHNGMTYMPVMANYLSQEALWAIRSWLVTKHVK